jgi:hypothetical protein
MNDMDKYEQIFLNLARSRLNYFPIIGCFHTGVILPSNAAPMPRDPNPPVGILLDDKFPGIFSRILSDNPAVHDGALMFGRTRTDENYMVTGWSFRLYPPPNAGPSEVNRGSAFNSCLSMSAVARVDWVFLASEFSVYQFASGVLRKEISAEYTEIALAN